MKIQIEVDVPDAWAHGPIMVRVAPADDYAHARKMAYAYANIEDWQQNACPAPVHGTARVYYMADTRHTPLEAA